ncbi:MAG: HAMP domain-containing histidine kinase [Burkholderiales bacterium]|jgi:signal transduction histidine kinase|nr:HAMP domain-containing histidine kinase [Burkholderiales bacterium]
MLSIPSLAVLSLLVFTLVVLAQYAAAREWEKLLWKPEKAGFGKLLKIGFLWGGLGISIFKLVLWAVEAPELSQWLFSTGYVAGYVAACGLMAGAVAWTLIKNDLSVKMWLAMVMLPALLFGFDTSLLNLLRLNVWEVYPQQLLASALFAVLFYAILRLATVSLGINDTHYLRSIPVKSFVHWCKNPKNSFLLACIVFDVLLLLLLHSLNTSHEPGWLFAATSFACTVYSYFLSVHSRAQTLKIQDELAWTKDSPGPRGPGMAMETTRLVSAALEKTNVSIFFWRATGHRKGLGSLDLERGSMFLSSSSRLRGRNPDLDVSPCVIGYLNATLHPEDFEMVTQELMRYLKREIPFFKVVTRVSDGYGGWKTVRGEVFAHWSEANGLPLYFYGSKVDITDEITEKDTLSSSKLRQLKALRIIGHDLATPLGTIMMSAELMQRRAKQEALDEFTLKTIDRVKVASGLALDYLMDTLTYARSEETADDMPIEDVELNTFIAQIVEKYTHRYGDSDSKVVLEIPASSTLLHVRRLALEMVLNNLISNAIKYTPALAGRVFIRVSSEPADTNNGGETTVIEIQDEGIGIPLEFKERLFNAYQRAENARDIQGLGLGLTIVQNGVNLLGARLGVESQPELESGSRFTLKLPNRLSTEENKLPHFNE